MNNTNKKATSVIKMHTGVLRLLANFEFLLPKSVSAPTTSTARCTNWFTLASTAASVVPTGSSPTGIVPKPTTIAAIGAPPGAARAAVCC